MIINDIFKIRYTALTKKKKEKRKKDKIYCFVHACNTINFYQFYTHSPDKLLIDI